MIQAEEVRLKYVTNIEQAAPCRLAEYKCDNCMFWFVGKNEYKILGCPACGQGFSRPENLVDIIKVVSVNETKNTIAPTDELLI